MLDLGQRLRADPLGVGRERLVACVVALDQGHDPGGHRDHEQDPRAGEQPAQAAVCPPLALGVAFAGGAALVEELPLDGVQVLRMALRPFQRRRKPGAAIEVRDLPAALGPQAGRVSQPAVQPQPLAVLVEPPAQRGPAADQHLVRDLRGAVAEGHEAGGREPFEQRLDGLGRGSLRDEILDPLASAGVLDPLAELGQPEEHGPHQGALVVRRSDSTSVSAVRATAEATPPLSR